MSAGSPASNEPVWFKSSYSGGNTTECLECAHTDGTSSGITWQFPAGEIEAAETPEQAAVRETREEVGVNVTALKLIGERVHPKTGRNMSYVACAVTPPPHK